MRDTVADLSEDIDYVSSSVFFNILNYYTVSLIYCRCSSFDKEMVDCYHNCERPSLFWI